MKLSEKIVEISDYFVFLHIQFNNFILKRQWIFSPKTPRF